MKKIRQAVFILSCSICLLILSGQINVYAVKSADYAAASSSDAVEVPVVEVPVVEVPAVEDPIAENPVVENPVHEISVEVDQIPGTAAVRSTSTPSNIMATPSAAVLHNDERLDQGGLEELLAWRELVRNEDQANEYPVFKLTEQIEWSGIYLYFPYPVTIDMNGYGITIPSSTMCSVSGDVTFVSSDMDMPMFTLKSGSYLNFSNEVSLIVSEGCGIFFEDSSAYIDLNMNFANMNVSGDGTVGIYGKGDLDIRCLRIEAEEGSCAVVGEGMVELFMSEILGAGECIQAGGQIYLDTCALSSMPADAHVSERTLSLVTGVNGSIFTSVGELPHTEVIDFYYAAKAPGQTSYYQKATVDVDLSQVDINQSGDYKALITSRILFQSEKLQIPRYELPVTVMDDSRQYLTRILSFFNQHVLCLAYPKLEDEELKLYCSVDGGENWELYEFYTVSFSQDEIYLDTELDADLSYLFKVELISDDGVKETNILQVEYENETFVGKSIGGKRDDSIRDPEEPTKPGAEEPSKPGAEEPTPTKPGTEEPTKPGAEEPTKPGAEEPTKPGAEDLTKPGAENPARPGAEDPTKPGAEKPSKPGAEKPPKPGAEDPTKPGAEKPSKPGTEGPSKSGTEDPVNPGQEKPMRPGAGELTPPDTEQLTKPGQEQSASSDLKVAVISGLEPGKKAVSGSDSQYAIAQEEQDNARYSSQPHQEKSGSGIGMKSESYMVHKNEFFSADAGSGEEGQEDQSQEVLPVFSGDGPGQQNDGITKRSAEVPAFIFFVVILMVILGIVYYRVTG